MTCCQQITLDTVTPEKLRVKTEHNKTIQLTVPGIIIIQCIAVYKMLKAYTTTNGSLE